MNQRKRVYIALTRDYDELAMQPWQRGYVDEQVNARAAIIAYAAIMRIMRCEK